MLKFIVAFLVSMFSSTLFAGDIKALDLTPDNTIVLRDAVSQHSVSRVILSLSVNKSKKIVLFLNSPGGDIIAGLELVNVIKSEIAHGREIVCVADYAASMAFSIMQSCSRRLILDGGVIMQHQASFGVRDKLLNLREEMKLNEALALKLNKNDAARIGIPLETFQSKIANDWWMFSEEAVEQRGADEMVTAKCSAALAKLSYTDTISSKIGTVVVNWSACPFVYEPLNVNYQPAPGVDMREFRKWLNSIALSSQWKARREVLNERDTTE